jgi:hypothetical protein
LSKPYLRLYKKPDTMDFYFDINCEEKTRAKYTEDRVITEHEDYSIQKNEIIYILNDRQI